MAAPRPPARGTPTGVTRTGPIARCAQGEPRAQGRPGTDAWDRAGPREGLESRGRARAVCERAQPQGCMIRYGSNTGRGAGIRMRFDSGATAPRIPAVPIDARDRAPRGAGEPWRRPWRRYSSLFRERLGGLAAGSCPVLVLVRVIGPNRPGIANSHCSNPLQQPLRNVPARTGGPHRTRVRNLACFCWRAQISGVPHDGVLHRPSENLAAVLWPPPVPPWSPRLPRV